MRTSSELAASLNRAKVLYFVLNAFLKSNPQKLNYLEIGTAFSEKEGLSTLLATTFITEANLQGRVYSIDIDAVNIEASKQIIRSESPELLNRVRYFEGNSLSVLENALQEMPTVDVAFIDGGADARVNLWEFLNILSHLSKYGIIVIDDVSYLAKTTYKARRDFGKAQLIYPLLLIAETLNTTIDAVCIQQKKDRESAIRQVISDSSTSNILLGLLSAKECLEFLDAVYEFRFAKVSSLLVLAREDVFCNYMGFSLDENLSAVDISRVARSSASPKLERNAKLDFNRRFNALLSETNQMKKRYESIILYGFGSVGKLLAPIIGDQLTGIVDIAADGEEHFGTIPVVRPENLKTMEADCVLISVLGREAEIEVTLKSKFGWAGPVIKFELGGTHSYAAL